MNSSLDFLGTFILFQKGEKIWEFMKNWNGEG